MVTSPSPLASQKDEKGFATEPPLGIKGNVSRRRNET